MGLPGFSAEESLYRSSGSYRAISALGPAAGGVLPSAPFDLYTPSFKFTDLFYSSLKDSAFVEIELGSWFFRCGGLGERCCRAPEASQNIPAFGPLVSCNKGLGCDITTNTCVANCGGTGQVCCDGPETRAPKWTADGKVYSPNNPLMYEMCVSGACDKQSHRCFSCGTTEGLPCCPPDAAQATARCIGGDYHFFCDFDPNSFYKSGTCKFCGLQGKKPCEDWGCDPGLGIRLGLCAWCGGDFQLPCDNGCKPGLDVANGLCRQCGYPGQIICDSGCKGGSTPQNGLCGCGPGKILKNGVCTACGNEWQVPCANGWCNPPLKVAAGVCRRCGANNEIACDGGVCNPGLVVNNGICRPPSQPPGQPPDTCATEGQACVPDHMQGMRCCKGGVPLLCMWGGNGNICRRCVPHGEECKLYGTQTCCDAKDGDSCVLDQFSGKVVCDIPG
jgi:hypothetical protein